METLETIKEIILDNQESKLVSRSLRNADLKCLDRKATICIGVRRCGKSTLLHQKIAAVKNAGEKENVLYINFFDGR